MAKTVIEELMGLLDADGQAKVKAIIGTNPKLAAQDKFLSDLGEAYSGFGGDTDTTAAAATTTTAASTTAAATHTPTTPTTASAAATSPTTTTGANDEIKTMLAGLRAQLEGLGTKFISKEEIPLLGAKLVNDAITRALVQTDELSTIRDSHREEFGEKFDSAAFKKFVADNDEVFKDAHGNEVKKNKYPTLTAAYDAMVADKRFKAKVDKEVADQLKQKRSGMEAAGQSSPPALSPAQQAIAKEKAAVTAAGKTNLQKAIDELARRDGSQSAAVN